ncbi:type 1 glutamine amidotransferase domain-containing protein [Phytohabitans houttuyneae]|uniref:Protease n=1 Tax=Phytohabitans houttuyneae TaxID=1076126 RepID=A0A6V8KES5_9ACTN|nr:type 1 glutamine amidotransferase domain-containing protein [Phytohabitans houttuyneae]GFJ80848.1 protease [Phytohabitans houttuyneae]
MDVSQARVAVLCENQYQELELWYPVLRLREAGATVVIVGPVRGEVYASKLGYPAVAEVAIDEVTPDHFDAVVVPGGFSPEYLRRNKAMVDFIKASVAEDKPVAAICHAGWLLATADVVKGRRATSVATIRDDVRHAGAIWLDEPVVRDGKLLTAQLPNDLPAFLAGVLDFIDEAEQVERPPLPEHETSSAVYDRVAVLKNRAAGPGSANYRAYAELA